MIKRVVLLRHKKINDVFIRSVYNIDVDIYLML